MLLNNTLRFVSYLLALYVVGGTDFFHENFYSEDHAIPFVFSSMMFGFMFFLGHYILRSVLAALPFFIYCGIFGFSQSINSDYANFIGDLALNVGSFMITVRAIFELGFTSIRQRVVKGNLEKALQTESEY